MNLNLLHHPIVHYRYCKSTTIILLYIYIHYRSYIGKLTNILQAPQFAHPREVAMNQSGVIPHYQALALSKAAEQNETQRIVNMAYGEFFTNYLSYLNLLKLNYV